MKTLTDRDGRVFQCPHLVVNLIEMLTKINSIDLNDIKIDLGNNPKS